MLKLQYFGYLMRRADSLEKTLILGKIEGRRSGQQRIRWLDSIINSMDMSLRRGKPGVLQSLGSQTQIFIFWLSDWTTTKNMPANAGAIRDAGLIPESGRSPVGGHGNPLQYSCLKNPMDRGAWRAIQSIGLQRVGHNRSDYTHTNTRMCAWERPDSPTPNYINGIIPCVTFWGWLFFSQNNSLDNSYDNS